MVVLSLAHSFSLQVVNFHLRLLAHVGFLRQNGLTLSEVFLYTERSKNHEKKYIITVQKNFTFLRRFDRKNTVFGISRNLIDKFVSNDSKCKKIMCP